MAPYYKNVSFWLVKNKILLKSVAHQKEKKFILFLAIYVHTIRFQDCITLLFKSIFYPIASIGGYNKMVYTDIQLRAANALFSYF